MQKMKLPISKNKCKGIHLSCKIQALTQQKQRLSLIKAIKFDDFEKLEIKVAEVIHVEKVEGSDKLLKFELDVVMMDIVKSCLVLHNVQIQKA